MYPKVYRCARNGSSKLPKKNEIVEQFHRFWIRWFSILLCGGRAHTDACVCDWMCRFFCHVNIIHVCHVFQLRFEMWMGTSWWLSFVREWRQKQNMERDGERDIRENRCIENQKQWFIYKLPKITRNSIIPRLVSPVLFFPSTPHHLEFFLPHAYLWFPVKFQTLFGFITGVGVRRWRWHRNHIQFRLCQSCLRLLRWANFHAPHPPATHRESERAKKKKKKRERERMSTTSKMNKRTTG